MELRVVPNPYLAVDHMGRPCAAVLEIVAHARVKDSPKHVDPAKRWASRSYVGARVAATRLTQDQTIRLKGRSHTISGKFDHAWNHSLDVVTVHVPSLEHEFGLYYKRAVADQSLFAADLETWTLLGGKPELFQDPFEKLAQAKEGAVAHFIAMHGEEDPRLKTLSAHLHGQVEQRHPVAMKLCPPVAAKPAPAAPAAPPPAPPTPSTTAQPAKGV